jgi:hypothetical protein
MFRMHNTAMASALHDNGWQAQSSAAIRVVPKLHSRQPPVERSRRWCTLLSLVANGIEE